MEPHTLPLKLTIEGINREPGGIEARCRITDAIGTSVEFLPITVGPQRTPAELCAILQGIVNDKAASLLRQEKATLGKKLSEEDAGQAFDDLVGREFTGSVTT
jgi:hypothetical protein